MATSSKQNKATSCCIRQSKNNTNIAEHTPRTHIFTSLKWNKYLDLTTIFHLEHLSHYHEIDYAIYCKIDTQILGPPIVSLTDPDVLTFSIT